MDSEKIASMIDHTALKPDVGQAAIDQLCGEAIDYSFCAVCVNPVYVERSASLLKEHAVKVCTVVGFPLGAGLSSVKAFEARQAVDQGAEEVDMVLSVGRLKDGRHKEVLQDIRAVLEVCRGEGSLLKVIFETCLLSEDEKRKACELCVEAGADYVKTSTGFSTGGATVEDIELMAGVVAGHGLGVKASGGIKTWQDAQRMIQAGATRIGTSSGIQILEQGRNQ